MSKTFASIISYLFHPMLFPTYGAALIIATNPHLFALYPLKAQVLWVMIVFIMTFIFPAVWLVVMRRLELIDDFKFLNARDRIIPYVATASFYMWTFKLFKPTTELTPYSNQLISLMMLGASIAIFIGFFVNIFKKISLHAIGAGALLGLVLSTMNMADFDLKGLLIACILLAGLIGTARLILEAHEAREIWYGYATGFVGQFVAFAFIPMVMGG